MSTRTDAMAQACDYSFTTAEATELLGVSLMPHDLRVKLLEQYAEKHGLAATVNLLSQFVGLANSVAANCREMAELVLIAEGGMHPHAAEKINLPTVYGALQGVKLAASITQAPLCAGCAYRQGTAANQSPITTFDAADCASGEGPFMCHENLSAEQPTRMCVGHAHAVKGGGATARRRAKETTSP